MEGITTSTHPEAYKDLLWLGNDKSLVSAAWAGQAGDVTRYKAMHLLNNGDSSTAYFTKLQEVARGTAKDMESKLVPLLKSAKPVANPGPKSLMSAEVRGSRSAAITRSTVMCGNPAPASFSSCLPWVLRRCWLAGTLHRVDLRSSIPKTTPLTRRWFLEQRKIGVIARRVA